MRFIVITVKTNIVWIYQMDDRTTFVGAEVPEHFVLVYGKSNSAAATRWRYRSISAKQACRDDFFFFFF